MSRLKRTGQFSLVLRPILIRIIKDLPKLNIWHTSDAPIDDVKLLIEFVIHFCDCDLTREMIRSGKGRSKYMGLFYVPTCMHMFISKHRTYSLQEIRFTQRRYRCDTRKCSRCRSGEASTRSLISSIAIEIHYVLEPATTHIELLSCSIITMALGSVSA